MNKLTTMLALVIAPLVALAAVGEDGGRFAGWSEEQYRHYEDSVCAVLYPPVMVGEADSLPPDTATSGNGASGPRRVTTTNTRVPTSVAVSTSREVGQIEVRPGVSQSGAKTYEVPIAVGPGMAGFQPSLSLSYNSQRGNSTLGIGWAISGLSGISRVSKTIYYDGETQAVSLDNGDAFTLDGIRLIRLGNYSGYILYETEQGNVKVKGHYAGDVMRYFEVFYPDGNKGVFGDTSNSTNKLQYPVTSLADLNGNIINYSYNQYDGTYRIQQVCYNGVSVNFSYISRTDPQLSFCGGYGARISQLLSDISCDFDGRNLWTYSLSYSVQNNVSLLTQISYEAGGKSFNPLRFYYGEGGTSDYTQSGTKLNEWYTSDSPAMIKVAGGRFDYASGVEGLIVLPNLNPYWKHYRHSTTFRHSQNRFDNKYAGDEKIFLYAGLNRSWANSLLGLTTGHGFVDILCADLEGSQEELVVKVNNLVVNGSDRVTFTVYRSNMISGLAELYSRTYSFPTVFTDADGASSIQPKSYYSGDFNGDGRMEIMAVSVHQPFGDTSKPSQCYIFDLQADRLLYQGHVFPFVVDFVGTRQTDPQDAQNNTDKLFAMDCDGDGKTDLCHIGDDGISVYTFEAAGDSLTARKMAADAIIDKARLENSDILVGEYNGDGLLDLLVSPPGTAGGGTMWTMLNSMGDGHFRWSTFSGPAKSSQDNSGFIAQDINGDGRTDIVKYDTTGFNTYLVQNNAIGPNVCQSTFPTPNSLFVPANINARSCSAQLVCLKADKVTKYTFGRNDAKETMMTGLANSLGVVEKNEYRLISEDEEGFYTTRYDAEFPYVNIREPLAVIAASETYIDGNLTERGSYTYSNAVFHFQGLGFCGFEEMTYTDETRDFQTVRRFLPCNRGLLVSEVTPETDKSYTYEVLTQANKKTRVNLTRQVEKDLLRGFTTTSAFTYDAYGYPTVEEIACSDSVAVRRVNTYMASPTVADGYSLGFLVDRVTTTTKGGSTLTEREYTPVYTRRRQPTVKIDYVNGTQVRQRVYDYDTHGNVVREASKPYSSQNSRTMEYEFDDFGRLTRMTDPLGLTEEYSYNDFGRVATKKDNRGGLTAYSYDTFGRETLTSFPDGTCKSTGRAWSSAATGGVYSVTEAQPGKAATIKTYDALCREVRTGESAFDGSIRSVDKRYDANGNVERQSLPFLGDTPTLWNIFAYDNHDRITSCTEASGRLTTHSYAGSAVTTVEYGVATTRQFDSQGRLVSVTDPSGTVTYNLDADGQPSSVLAPGDVTTSFGYDNQRRRIELGDPSKGTITYEYDAEGNLSKETDANGKSITYGYDAFGRLTRKTTPEFTSTYTYNSSNELTCVASTNGCSKTFAYDSCGRVTSERDAAPDGVWLQKDYTYSDGNVSEVRYASRSGLLATESRVYANGRLVRAIVNGADTVFCMHEANALGLPTKVVTGDVERDYSYTPFGLPTGRKAATPSGACQDFSYDFDAATSNLLARTDNLRGLTEDFDYDGLNRLTAYGGNAATYDAKGNITAKSDVGKFAYGLASKPYAMTKVTLTESAVPYRDQAVDYTSFSRPLRISENGYVAEFDYDSNYDRVKMAVTKDSTALFARYYLGNCYEIELTNTGAKERLYLAGDYYEAPAVMVKTEGVSEIYYILRDHLGSVTHTVASDGSIVQELSYDAWGRLCDPDTHEAYKPGEEPELFLCRGYTGHEHLSMFGLVNMNARLYDPALGRFLSPDPLVQMPDAPQNFNRYSYTINNPLKYRDTDGEFFFFTILNAFTDLIGNLCKHGLNVSQYNWKRTVNAVKIDLGMFKGNFGQVLNKWTFGLINSVAGNVVSQFYNTVGEVDRVTDLDGMLALSGATKGNAAFTIGHYSLGPDGYVADWRDHLFVHEYGHYIQSQRWGFFYFRHIALPSLFSAAFTSRWSGAKHGQRWFESDASHLGATYFDKHYGRGAPGYKDGDENFFDIAAFREEKYRVTSYINPRTNDKWQDKISPTVRRKFNFWDFMIF